MTLVIKRLFGTLIDILIYLLLFFIFIKLTQSHQYTFFHHYFYLASFIITILFPVYFIDNTIGNKLMGINWIGSSHLKIKLSIKYIFYYLSLIPDVSIFSAIIDFPKISHWSNSIDKLIPIIFLTSFLTANILILTLSKGKFNLLDYFLRIKIKKYTYQRNPLIFLAIFFLFFFIYLNLSMFSFKKNFTFSRVENLLYNSIIIEHYPSDNFYGEKVLTINQRSDGVFIPSNVSSFFYEKKLLQKTLFLQVPKDIFNSENERKAICINLLRQSLLNDFAFNSNTEQTRIILTNFEEGFFLEYYTYFYIYYFDNNFNKWDIYGGIETDSTNLKNFMQIDNNRKVALADKVKLIEDKYNLPWNKILKQSETNEKLQNEIIKIISSSYLIEIKPSFVNISIEENSIQLKKIDFEKAKLHGYFSLNFPLTEKSFNFNFTDIIDGRTLEFDENIETLKILRNHFSEFKD